MRGRFVRPRAIAPRDLGPNSPVLSSLEPLRRDVCPMPHFDFTYRELSPQITLWEVSGQPDAGGWARMLREWSGYLAQLELRGKRMSFLIDPSDLSPIDAALRRAAGHWRAENMALIANVVPCASYVAKNAWIRGAITAIFWFAPPVVPVGVKGTRREALAWIENELAARAQ